MPKKINSPMLEAHSNASLSFFRGVRELDFSDCVIKEFLKETGITNNTLLEILDNLAEHNLIELESSGCCIYVNLTKAGKLKCLSR